MPGEFHSAIGDILLNRYTHSLPEEAGEIVLAQAHLPCQTRNRQGFAKSLVENLHQPIERGPGALHGGGADWFASCEGQPRQQRVERGARRRARSWTGWTRLFGLPGQLDNVAHPCRYKRRLRACLPTDWQVEAIGCRGSRIEVNAEMKSVLREIILRLDARRREGDAARLKLKPLPSKPACGIIIMQVQRMRLRDIEETP